MGVISNGSDSGLPQLFGAVESGDMWFPRGNMLFEWERGTRVPGCTSGGEGVSTSYEVCDVNGVMGFYVRPTSWGGMEERTGLEFRSHELLHSTVVLTT